MAEGGFFQNQVRCSLCGNLMTNPVTISCGHSYCIGCFTKYLKNETEHFSCPRCQITPGSAFGNIVLDEVLDRLHTMNLQTSGAEDVECDGCTGRKNKAVKSCWECMKSYCQYHLDQHEVVFQPNRHNLMNPTRRLNEMICPKHGKHLEIYCRTDQHCICCWCLMEGHSNHEIVVAEAERNEKQIHLKEKQRKVQQRIQEREKELQWLKEVAATYKRFAQTAVEDCEKIFTELIRSIARCRLEVTKLIRDQETAAMCQAESLCQQLQQEIADLKRRETKMEQLSRQENPIQFLQRFQSVSAALESKVSYNITVSPLIFFDEVSKSISELKEKLENFCKEDTEKISEKVPHITFIRPNEPKTRKEFLQYFSKFTLDSNTANRCLRLSDEDRRATDTDIHQQYPDHPERFDYCAQVLCKEGVSERCYWEVEWTGNEGVYISVAYKTISRKSDDDESLFGYNNQSWGVYCRPFNNSPPSLFHRVPMTDSNVMRENAGGYTGLFQALVKPTPQIGGQSLFGNIRRTTDLPVSSSCSTIGVYVDHSAGTLCFYSVSDTMTLIHRVQTTFTQPLYPGFTLYKGSAVKLFFL